MGMVRHGAMGHPRRSDAWWLAVAPLGLAAAAYGWILGVWFEGDDFIHLYDLADLGPFGFVLRSHGGHALIVPYLVMWLTHAGVGLFAPGYMATVLLAHLVNVFLCYRVGRTITGDPYAASAAAAAWAVAPSAAGTLGWYSVFGQVLATTVLLVILLLIARRADDARPVPPATVAGWLALSLLGAFSFGTGLAVALVLPAMIALLVPRVVRSPAVRAQLFVGPFVVAVIYAAYLLVGARWWGVPAPGASHFVRIGASAYGAAALFAHLLFRGASDLLQGAVPWWELPIVAGAIVLSAILCGIAWPPAPRWRTAGALALATCAAYGMIAVGRGIVSSAVMDAPRYHYLAQAPLALLSAIALARCAAGREAWRRGAVLAWLALLAVGVAQRGWPELPHDAAKRRELEDVRATIETAVRATPAGEVVYIRNRPYRGGELLMATPQFFPGWAGVFCVLYPDNTVEGRAVRFVEGNPAVRRDDAIGRCGRELLVASAPPGATVW